jgi:hypothetical protein
VNANKSGSARFVELPGTGHTFQRYPGMEEAFQGKEAAFDPAPVQVLTDWFKQTEAGHGDEPQEK